MQLEPSFFKEKLSTGLFTIYFKTAWTKDAHLAQMQQEII